MAVKIGAVVGNPPYQEEVAKKKSETNGQARRQSIFQYFQLTADEMSTSCTSLIYPGGRWIHRSGKGMEDFGRAQINDRRLAQVDFYPVWTEVFPTAVEIADGLTIVRKDMKKSTSGFEYVYHREGKAQVFAMDNPGDALMPLDPNDGVIVDKVRAFCHSQSIGFLCNKVLSQKFFRIESEFVEENPTLVRPYDGEEKLDYSKEIKLFTNDRAGKAGRAKWYVANRNIIKVNADAIDQWKVVVSSANAGGQKRDWQLEVLDNHSAFGRARVALKIFQTKREAMNFYGYCKSHLIRFLFLMTDEALTTLAKEVPDFVDYSGKGKWLDFSKNIDKQLYALFGMTADEVAHVETRIKTIDEARNK